MNPKIQNAQIAGLLQAPTAPPASRAPQPDQGADFRSILEDRLKLSGHAQARLQSRGIELTDSDWSRVMAGVQKAASKGAKESLVMKDDVALVVSVRNRTVITAVDKASLKDNVFTNIDSAVIV